MSTMKEIYNQEYLKNTLDTLADNLDELEIWSIWNDDEKSDEIHAIKELVELLTEQLTK